MTNNPRSDKRQDQLPNVAASVSGAKKRLNPRFVEWLMGLPLGWTDFEPLEMP
jgi:hypothetical protein